MGKLPIPVLCRFLGDRRAAAAVEFALILPVMLIAYLGMFEASQAIIAKRRVDNAAETVGGIVARSPDMDATRMRNLLMISNAIVGSSSGQEPEVTVTTVRTDAKGQATVDWARRGTVQTAVKGARYQLPSDLAGLPETYFVFSKIAYTYRPTFDVAGLFGTLRFERTFAFRPRKGAEIPWR